MATVQVAPMIDVPETDAFREEGSALVVQATAMTVENQEDYSLAASELQRVSAIRKAIVEAFRVPKAKAHEAHKAITELESDLLAYPTQAETIIKNAMRNWQLAEQAKARIEQQRIQTELRKQEEAKRAAEAERLSKAGKKEEAKAVAAAPVVVPEVHIPVPKPQADGIQTRKGWDFKITDQAAIKREFLIANEKLIRGYVKDFGKEAEKTVGGIEVFETLGIVNRG